MAPSAGLSRDLEVFLSKSERSGDCSNRSTSYCAYVFPIFEARKHTDFLVPRDKRRLLDQLKYGGGTSANLRYTFATLDHKLGRKNYFSFFLQTLPRSHFASQSERDKHHSMAGPQPTSTDLN